MQMYFPMISAIRVKSQLGKHSSSTQIYATFNRTLWWRFVEIFNRDVSFYCWLSLTEFLAQQSPMMYSEARTTKPRVSLMTTQQPLYVVISKAAGYGFNPFGLSKCNIWVTAKLYSAHLISSVAHEFSWCHQHLQFSGIQWEIKARLQVILLHLAGAPWHQKLQPAESPRVIYMQNHTMFQHRLSIFLLRYSSGSK